MENRKQQVDLNGNMNDIRGIRARWDNSTLYNFK